MGHPQGPAYQRVMLSGRDMKYSGTGPRLTYGYHGRGGGRGGAGHEGAGGV